MRTKLRKKKESKLNYKTMRIQCEAIDFDWIFEEGEIFEEEE